jgi:hypothetical protein
VTSLTANRRFAAAIDMSISSAAGEFALAHDRCSRLRHTRRFPPPWSVEEGQTWFVVKDNGGQKLAYVHFDDPRSAATRDEARRIVGGHWPKRSTCWP